MVLKVFDTTWVFISVVLEESCPIAHSRNLARLYGKRAFNVKSRQIKRALSFFCCTLKTKRNPNFWDSFDLL